MNDFIEIGKNYFILMTPEKDFHRNIYVKKFVKNGSSVNLIMDPGSKSDIELLSEKLKKLIGGMNKIDIIFLSHQDPDVTSIVPYIVALNPNVIILSSIDTIRLLKSYGIPNNNFRAIEDFKTDSITIKSTGNRIKFISAAYCHFRGAMMLYDYESNILFSGDFLGGVNVENEKKLEADEKSFEGISLFHQIYMPSSVAIKNTINRIGLLNPFPETIAPQHGSIIKDDYVLDFLNRLSNLNVGVDLMLENEPSNEIFIVALNDFKDKIKEKNPSTFAKIINKLRNPGNFTTPIIFSGDNVVALKMHYSEITKLYIDTIDEFSNENEKDEIKNILISTFERYGLPILNYIFKSDKSKVERKDLFD